MMKFGILCLFFVGVLAARACNADPLNSNEEEARAFIQRSSPKMFDCNDELTNKLFGVDTESNEEMDGIQMLLKARKKTVAIVNESKQFDDSKFTDLELKYVFKIIRKSAKEAVLGGVKFINMIQSFKMLEELASDKDIPGYRNETIQLAFYPDIQNIFAKSKDPEELKYYWTTWREKNGAWAIGNFLNLVKSWNEAARLTEITPSEFWLHGYNITEMRKVVKQIRPLYKRLHAFIRSRLNKKYGDSVIKPHGPIPHHLFEQVLAQAWTPGSIIDDFYPHKDLPPYDEILQQNNFDTLKIFKMADQFYKSLGLNPIPDDYWGSRFIMSSDEDKGDCKATVFDETPTVFMEYCQKMDFRKFLQAHGYMGQIYYAREKADLPAYYFDAHDLQYPVGEAVVLSASTPKHLSAIGLVTDFKFTEEVKMNRLLRMGIHTLLNVPVYYIHTKVMNDLFDGTVDITDLNKHYWKLMEKHAGVAPPVDRGEDSYDFPFKFYTELPNNKQATKFMTEVLGYQFYEKLCEISGQYSKTDKSVPINNCDFYGSKKAGDALKTMMKLGSSKPMREVLATMFPEVPSVSAASLIEYYAPMKSWLVKMNREENVRLGWSHSDKKVSIVTHSDEEFHYDEE